MEQYFINKQLKSELFNYHFEKIERTIRFETPSESEKQYNLAQLFGFINRQIYLGEEKKKINGTKIMEFIERMIDQFDEQKEKTKESMVQTMNSLMLLVLMEKRIINEEKRKEIKERIENINVDPKINYQLWAEVNMLQALLEIEKRTAIQQVLVNIREKVRKTTIKSKDIMDFITQIINRLAKPQTRELAAIMIGTRIMTIHALQSKTALNTLKDIYISGKTKGKAKWMYFLGVVLGIKLISIYGETIIKEELAKDKTSETSLAKLAAFSNYKITKFIIFHNWWIRKIIYETYITQLTFGIINEKKYLGMINARIENESKQKLREYLFDLENTKVAIERCRSESMTPHIDTFFQVDFVGSTDQDLKLAVSMIPKHIDNEPFYEKINNLLNTTSFRVEEIEDYIETILTYKPMPVNFLYLFLAKYQECVDANASIIFILKVAKNFTNDELAYFDPIINQMIAEGLLYEMITFTMKTLQLTQEEFIRFLGLFLKNVDPMLQANVAIMIAKSNTSHTEAFLQPLFWPTFNEELLSLAASYTQLSIDEIKIIQPGKCFHLPSKMNTIRIFLKEEKIPKEEKEYYIYLIGNVWENGCEKFKNILISKVNAMTDKFDEGVSQEVLLAFSKINGLTISEVIDAISIILDLEMIKTNEFITKYAFMDFLGSLDPTKSLLKSLKSFKSVVFMKKFPEKPFDELQTEFLVQQFPLPMGELEDMMETYTQITTYFNEREFYNLTEKDIPAEVEKVKQIKGIPVVPTLALIRQCVYLERGYFPYNTQMLVVLGLLKSNNGRIAQVKTGQGKSIIVAILATYYAIFGRQIDIVTTSKSLANRDAHEMKSFFKMFGITVDSCSIRSNFATRFKSQIVYGTPFDFEWAALQDEYSFKKVRHTRPYDIVIVDEVDSMFIDKLSSATQLIYNDDKFHQIAWVYEFLIKLIKDEPDLSRDEVKKKIFESPNYKGSSKFIKSFIDNMAEGLAKSIILSKSYKEGVNYVVKEKKVMPVDYRHTGEVKSNSSYSGGLHQILEIRHGIFPSLDSLLGSFISHVNFFKRYKFIYGLSGTVGSQTEREELKNYYNIETFDVPLHIKSAPTYLEPQFCENLQDWYGQIVKDVEIEAKKGRPVLVLFENIRDTRGLMKYINNPNAEVLNGTQPKPEEEIVAAAGKPGKITVATNLAGRGTDIRTWDEAEANGGTHVIISFFPLNDRVQAQAEGRTARQGKQGTVRLILNKQDYKSIPSTMTDNLSMIQFLDEKRIEEEKERSKERVDKESKLARVFDNMVIRICEVFKKIHDNEESYVLKGVQGTWTAWFTECERYLKDKQSSCTTPELDSIIEEKKLEFNELVMQLQTDVANGNAIKDPHLWLKKALNHKANKRDEKAIECCKKAFDCDEYFSQAYLVLGQIYEKKGDHPNAQYHYKYTVQMAEYKISLNRLNLLEYAVLATAQHELGFVDASKDTMAKAQQIVHDYMSIKDYNVLIELADDMRILYLERMAIIFLTDAIKLDSKNKKAFYVRGKCYKDIQEFAMAKRDFEHALMLDPDYQDAYEFLGWNYYREGIFHYNKEEYARSIICLLEAYKIHHDNEDVIFKLADAYEEYKNFEIAERFYLKSYALNVDRFRFTTAKFYNSWSCHYSNLNQYKLALNYVEKALANSRNGDDESVLGVFHANRGLYLHQLGRFSEALPEYNIAIQYTDEQKYKNRVEKALKNQFL